MTELDARSAPRPGPVEPTPRLVFDPMPGASRDDLLAAADECAAAAETASLRSMAMDRWCFHHRARGWDDAAADLMAMAGVYRSDAAALLAGS